MKFIVFILLTVSFMSCQKEPEQFCTDAVVMWGGDPAVDGLGWYLLTDSVQHQFYIPGNLHDSLKIHHQPVNVCLVATNENFSCECSRPLKKYRITSITKR